MSRYKGPHVIKLADCNCGAEVEKICIGECPRCDNHSCHNCSHDCNSCGDTSCEACMLEYEGNRYCDEECLKKELLALRAEFNNELLEAHRKHTRNMSRLAEHIDDLNKELLALE